MGCQVSDIPGNAKPWHPCKGQGLGLGEEAGTADDFEGRETPLYDARENFVRGNEGSSPTGGGVDNGEAARCVRRVRVH